MASPKSRECEDASEALENIYNLSMDMICEASMTHFLKVNPAFERALGYTEEELRKMPFIELIHPDDVEPTRKALEEKLKMGIPAVSFVNRYRHKDGTYRWLEWMTKPVPEKGLLYGVARDITERKLAMEALEKSEAEWMYAMDFFEDAIYLTDMQDRVVRANKAFHALTGLSPDETIGKDITAIMHPQGEPVPCPVCVAIRARRDGTVTMEADHPGNPLGRPIEVMVRMIRNAEGEPVGVLMGIHDLTRYREAEEKIMKSLREKEVLLREVHHRVKNNMAVISSMLGLQAKYSGDDRIKELIRESQSRIKSMALVHERLYQSEDISGVSVREYIEGLAEHISAMYESKSKHIEVALDVDDIRLELDVLIPCGLIISELLSNSFKHAFAGREGGTVSIAVKADKSGTNAVLEISDDGVGLPEGVNLSAPSSFGLNIVKALVLQLKGSLKAKNGKGATFSIAFPTRLQYAGRDV